MGYSPPKKNGNSVTDSQNHSNNNNNSRSSSSSANRKGKEKVAPVSEPPVVVDIATPPTASPPQAGVPPEEAYENLGICVICMSSKRDVVSIILKNTTWTHRNTYRLHIFVVLVVLFTLIITKGDDGFLTAQIYPMWSPYLLPRLWSVMQGMSDV